MAAASEEKPISSRNICSRHGKQVPARGGWEQMEQQSFSSSCLRPTASDAHHPCPASLSSCTEQPWSRGWQKGFNCSLWQGFPRVNPVPGTTLLLARQLPSLACLPGWGGDIGTSDLGEGEKVRAASGGVRREAELSQARER